MTQLTMKNLICAVIVLSIALLAQHGVFGGRQELIAGISTAPALASASMTVPSSASLGHQEISLLDQLLAGIDENDELYDAMLQKKYHRQQPNYLNKWPGLRDLLLTAVDYEDENGNNDNNNNLNEIDQMNEMANLRFIERLRQMAAISSHNSDLENVREENGSGVGNENIGEIVPTGISYKTYGTSTNGGSNGSKQLTFKQHGTKKNVHYMSPCHFKICNMGRKRNARYLTTY